MNSEVQAPLKIGNYTIHALDDIGDQGWPVARVFPEARREDFTKSIHATDATYDAIKHELRFRFGGHLVIGAGGSILVDCGVGIGKNRRQRGWGQRSDRGFIDSLSILGLSAEDIDIVVITHAHVDHVGWLTTPQGVDGWKPTFDRAEHVFAAAELDHWLEVYSQNPAVNSGSIGDSVVPLLGRVSVVRGDDGYEIAPGVTLRVYPGHTPGNAVVWVESDHSTAAICGDMLHHPIQLSHPSWLTQFCYDSYESAMKRAEFLREVVERDAVLIPSHFRVPPNRIMENADGYIYVTR